MALSAELLGDGQYEGSTIAGVVGRRLLFIDAGAFFGMNAMRRARHRSSANTRGSLSPTLPHFSFDSVS